MKLWFFSLKPLSWLGLQTSINWHCINISLLYLPGWKWQQLLRYWPKVWGEHIHVGRAWHHGREHFLAPLPPGSEPWASGEMPGRDQGHPGGRVFYHLVRSAFLNISSFFLSLGFVLFFPLVPWEPLCFKICACRNCSFTRETKIIPKSLQKKFTHPQVICFIGFPISGV